MPHSPSHARRKPPRLFPALTVTVATAALTGGALAAAGPAGATTAEPATTVRAVHDGQLWETHRHHLITMARTARGYYGASVSVRSGDTEPDGDSDDRTSAVPASAGPTGGSGFEQCVIRTESGGASQVMNPTGHYGLFQFDYSTWVSGGGSGADFGHASVAEQQSVFNAVYAARGTQPWTPSDGCR